METKFYVRQKAIAPTIFKGEGVVTETDGKGSYPIEVIKDVRLYVFTKNGKRYESTDSPALLPAGTKITIEEAEPVRPKWANIYFLVGSGEYRMGVAHDSETKALKEISKDKNEKYLKTICLEKGK